MTLKDAKIKVYALIEELDLEEKNLTADPDISAKANEIFNQKMFELCRIKKLPKYVELDVKKGDVIQFADIEKECGYEIYQVCSLSGVLHIPKANGTVFKILEDGIAEIDCFVYPERITSTTKDEAYEFELPPDVLEIMPYGVAADLLMSDVSANYGAVYLKQYETMLQRLDPRYQTSSIKVTGGIKI